jgi:hypothetical protein
MLDFDWFPHPLIMAASWTSLAEELKDMREPLERMRTYAATIMPRNIDDQGGGEWPELDSDTLDRRSAGAILIDTGALYSAVGDEGLWELGDEEVRMGGIPSPYYAEFHLTGTEFMPQRDYAYFLPQDVDECEQIAWQWLDEVTS